MSLVARAMSITSRHCTLFGVAAVDPTYVPAISYSHVR